MAVNNLSFLQGGGSGGNNNRSFAINQAIPELGRLTGSASSIISNALNGLPSPNEARLANAYFGAGSGLDPTSEFLNRRGFDLYNRQSNARQQQGLTNLMNLVSTYSGTVAPTPGQELANTTQNRQIDVQNQQFNTNYNFEQQQWQKQLELLNRYLNPTATTGGGGRSPLASGLNAGDYSMYSQSYVPFGSNTRYLNDGTLSGSPTPGTGYSLSADGYYRPTQKVGANGRMMVTL